MQMEACNLQSGWWMSWVTVHDVGWEGTLRCCDGEPRNQPVLFSGLVGVKRKEHFLLKCEVAPWLLTSANIPARRFLLNVANETLIPAEVAGHLYILIV